MVLCKKMVKLIFEFQVYLYYFYFFVAGAKMQSALEKIQNESVERKRILKKSKILGLTTNVIVKQKRKKTKDMKKAAKAKKQ